jgi:hypothetical protein
VGLNGLSLALDATPANAPATDSYFTNETLTFQADINFVNNGGTDQIEILYTMFNDFGSSTASNTLNLITVDAADYTGGFFGFAGRTRNDGSAPPGDSIANYNSFSVVQVPEPSSFALLAGGLGGMMLLRRRSS